jgi:hypothetical protein
VGAHTQKVTEVVASPILSNKPLFGFAKRHRETDPRMQVELNIALDHHAHEGNLKGVHLYLWAGADPHAPRHPQLSVLAPSNSFR